MKQLMATVFLLIVMDNLNAQSQKEKEMIKKLSDAVCHCITEYHSLYEDSVIIPHCFQLALKETEGAPRSSGKIETMFSWVHYQLQKDCRPYFELVNRLSPPKGDWAFADSTLAVKLDSAQCRAIESHASLYYIEASGDTTGLTLKDGYWMDSFKKGKYYSKCTMRWLSGCEFELEFVKSNEPGRSKLSYAGDKYYYRIIDRTDNYYLLLTHLGKMWTQFKIYYK